MTGGSRFRATKGMAACKSDADILAQIERNRLKCRPEALETWREYFNLERVMQIRGRLDELMNGWQIDGGQTNKDFNYLYLKRVHLSKFGASPHVAEREQVHVNVQRKSQSQKQERKSKKRRHQIKDEERLAKDYHPQKALQRVKSNSSNYEYIPDSYTLFGKPASAQHYRKLVRFSQTLRSNGRQLPFLLRNIVSEEENSLNTT